MSKVNFVTPVETQIQLVEDKMRAQADERHPDLRAALEHLLSAGGKRVRPTVVLLVGNMLCGDSDKLITLAAAVEMLHTATLVHDDLIDGALLRRGTPTMNARWSPAATVLTGDFVFARAAKLAAETESISVMKHFANTLAIIVNGELTQMFASKGVANRENYYQRIYAKTASLFETSAYAASLICNVTDDEREAMRRYGYNIGMAFQIVDDILDFTGDENKVGKPVGSDLLNGLITLPTLYYIESHPNDPDVRELAEGGYADPGRVARMVEAVKASSSTHKAMGEANAYVTKARETLTVFPEGPEQDALEELALYIVDRDF